jgi:hypothetical protein
MNALKIELSEKKVWMDEISSVLCSRFLLALHFHVVSEYEDALYDQENADDDS